MATTVILGAGIIGVSTAYYLSQTQLPSSIHLVEPSPTLFASASGYTAGFLAENWFSSSTSSVGSLSFLKHKKLAEQFGGRENWGYERSTGINYIVGHRSTSGDRGDDWLRSGGSRVGAAGVDVNKESSEGDTVESIIEEGTTAQVDPLRLSHFLLQNCLDRGVQLLHPAKAISVHADIRDELSSVRILNTDTNSESDIPCAKILIAAGAWSGQVFAALFPKSMKKLPISSLAGHSLVVRYPRWDKEHEEKGCHATFVTSDDGYSPEIFSRIGGEIYVAGLNDPSIPLPDLATESKIDEGSIEMLKKTAKALLSGKGDVNDLEVVRTGLCFRPVSKNGTPILSRIPDKSLGNICTRGGAEGGVWLAAGHGPWGISLSLGSGRVMAEMIQGRPTSASILGLGL